MIMGKFLLRREDHMKPAMGTPDLPPGFVLQIQKSTVRCRIARVIDIVERPYAPPRPPPPEMGPPEPGARVQLPVVIFGLEGYRTARIIIDKGRKDGLGERTKLFVVNFEEDWGTVTIEKVFDDHAEARLEQHIFTRMRPPTPEPGWLLEREPCWTCWRKPE